MRSRSGPGESATILGNLWRRAAAHAVIVAVEPAWAGIHRCDEHEARGKDRRPRRASDGDAAFFKRLAKNLECATIELRHLVEKEHTVVREGDLTRARNGATADERDIRRRCDAARVADAR